MEETRLMLTFIAPNGEHTLMFEDDGKVAYAYLKEENATIVGDVWLYNRCPTPPEPEWSDRSKIPFANSRAYTSEEGRVERDVQARDVLVDWENEDGNPVAYVYLFEDLCGVVGVGDKPGYARFATKSGRLARVMEIEESTPSPNATDAA
jgi:hypothetical protein